MLEHKIFVETRIAFPDQINLYAKGIYFGFIRLLSVVDSDLVENEGVVPRSHLTENVELWMGEEPAQETVAVTSASKDNENKFQTTYVASASMAKQFQDYQTNLSTHYSFYFARFFVY